MGRLRLEINEIPKSFVSSPESVYSNQRTGSALDKTETNSNIIVGATLSNQKQEEKRHVRFSRCFNPYHSRQSRICCRLCNSYSLCISYHARDPGIRTESPAKLLAMADRSKPDGT